jgi:hypothetical protein
MNLAISSRLAVLAVASASLSASRIFLLRVVEIFERQRGGLDVENEGGHKLLRKIEPPSHQEHQA